MKVGTDSILFGSWLVYNSTYKSVLDIGAGTGLLTLMIAQKWPAVNISALEINPDAYLQAKDNIIASKWADRISVYHTDANTWKSTQKFDLFISNPPYFSNSINSKLNSNNIARHQVVFKLQNLIDMWEKHGSEKSELACVLPVDQAEALIKSAISMAYFLKRQTIVRSNEKSKSIRQLLLFSKYKAPTITSELCIYSVDKTYTKEYIELTKDYYLGL